MAVAAPGEAPCRSLEALRQALEADRSDLALEGIRSAAELASCLALLSQPQGLAGQASLRVSNSALEAGGLRTLGAALRSACGGEASSAPQDDGNGEDDDDGGGFDLFDADAGGVDSRTTAGNAGPESAAEGAAEAAAGSAGAAGSGAGTNDGDVRVGLRALAIVGCPGVASDVWASFWPSIPEGLAELDLTANALSDHAVGALCGALRRARPPARLVLRGNRCKDIERICGLISDRGLRELDLAENLLNDKSVAQLREALASSASTLHRLRLSGNRRLTSAGLGGLFQGLPKGPLRALELDGTALCDKGAATLEASLPRCPLERLEVHDTALSGAGARQLLEAARRAPRLQSLTVDEGGERVVWRRCSGMADLLGGA